MNFNLRLLCKNRARLQPIFEPFIDELLKSGLFDAEGLEHVKIRSDNRAEYSIRFTCKRNGYFHLYNFRMDKKLVDKNAKVRHTLKLKEYGCYKQYSIYDREYILTEKTLGEMFLDEL